MERCKESLAPEEKVCGPPCTLLEERCLLLRLFDGLSARPALLFHTDDAVATCQSKERGLYRRRQPTEPGEGSLSL